MGIRAVGVIGLAIGLSLAGGVRPALAREIFVPSPEARSLGAALGAAEPGDTITIRDLVTRARNRNIVIRTPGIHIRSQDGFRLVNSRVRIRANGVQLSDLHFVGTRIDARGDGLTIKDCTFDGVLRSRTVSTVVRVRGDRYRFDNNDVAIEKSRRKRGLRMLRVMGDDARVTDNRVTVVGSAIEIEGSDAIAAGNHLRTLPPTRPHEDELLHAIRIDGSNARIQSNDIDAITRGIQVTGDGAKVSENTVVSGEVALRTSGDLLVAFGNSLSTLHESHTGEQERHRPVSLNGADIEFRGNTIEGYEGPSFQSDGLWFEGNTITIPFTDEPQQSISFRGDDSRILDNVMTSARAATFFGERTLVSDLELNVRDHGPSLAGDGLKAENVRLVHDTTLTYGVRFTSGRPMLRDSTIANVEIGALSERGVGTLLRCDVTATKVGVQLAPAGVLVDSCRIHTPGGTSATDEGFDSSFGLTVRNSEFTGPPARGIILGSAIASIEESVFRGVTGDAIRLDRRPYAIDLNVIEMDPMTGGRPIAVTAPNTIGVLGSISENRIVMGAGLAMSLLMNDMRVADNVIERVAGSGVIAMRLTGNDNQVQANRLDEGTAPGGGLHVVGLRNQIMSQTVTGADGTGLLVEGGLNIVEAVVVTQCSGAGLINHGDRTSLSNSMFLGNGGSDIETSQPFEVFENVEYGVISGP